MIERWVKYNRRGGIANRFGVDLDFEKRGNPSFRLSFELVRVSSSIHTRSWDPRPRPRSGQTRTIPIYAYARQNISLSLSLSLLIATNSCAATTPTHARRSTGLLYVLLALRHSPVIAMYTPLRARVTAPKFPNNLSPWVPIFCQFSTHYRFTQPNFFPSPFDDKDHRLESNRSIRMFVS